MALVREPETFNSQQTKWGISSVTTPLKNVTLLLHLLLMTYVVEYHFFL